MKIVLDYRTGMLLPNKVLDGFFFFFFFFFFFCFCLLACLLASLLSSMVNKQTIIFNRRGLNTFLSIVGL